MDGEHPFEFMDDLVRLIHDPNGGVREAAARAVEHSAWMIGPRHLKSLWCALADDSSGVRHSAAHALSRLSDHLGNSDVDLLLRSILDRDEGVRSAIGRALAAIRWRLKPFHIRALQEMLSDADAVTRCAITEILGPLLLTDVFFDRDRLLELASQNEADKVGIRYAAIQAIGELGESADHRHLAVLFNGLRNTFDWTTRFESQRALRRWHSLGLRAVWTAEKWTPWSVFELSNIDDKAP